jgi:predicted site-specific integrase-resolvase
MSKYISASNIQKTYKVSTATLRRWDEERRLKQCEVKEGKYSTKQMKLTDFFKRKDKEYQQEKGCVII